MHAQDRGPGTSSLPALSAVVEESSQLREQSSVTSATSLFRPSSTAASPSARSLHSRRSDNRLQELVGASGSRLLTPQKRPLSGRFRFEELSCFRRVHTPSPTCSKKVQGYWSATGDLRRTASEKCLHTLPVMKGNFYATVRDDQPPSQDRAQSSSVKQEKVASPTEIVRHELPNESKTAVVLEEIFPRVASAAKSSCPSSSPMRADEDRSCLRKTGNRNRSLMPGPLEGGLRARSGRIPGPALGTRKTTADRHDRGPISRLLQFRQKMLEQFSTLSLAFDTFIAELKTPELSRKEFHRFLHKHLVHLSKEEQESIFEFLDNDKNGSISLKEFERAIEAHTPVRTLEDLRRKWIALGFGSMRQVIKEMDPSRENISRRLTLTEFGPMLLRVGITEEIEQGVIFKNVSDTNDENGTTTLNELSSALAAISPSLLLEDIRDRLIKQFGSLKEAFAVLDIDKDVKLKRTEFINYAVQHWRMSAYEAKKAFHLMDVSSSSTLTRTEFVSALALSEPDLHLEEIRKKVRQRYKSIREALECSNEEEEHSGKDGLGDTHRSTDGLAESRRRRSDSPLSPVKGSTFVPGGAAARDHAFGGQSGGLSSTRGDKLDFLSSFKEGRLDYHEKEQQTPEEFHAILSQVQFSEMDTQVLFQMADIDGDGCLEPTEFNRAILLFAPCCVLEDLRLECFRSHARVKDAFASVPSDKRDAILELEELKQLLEDLDLSVGVDVEAVHDVVEPLREGGITVGELIVALQASASGATVPLTEDELNARARQQIHWQMAPFHRSAAELRQGLRQKYVDNKQPRHAEHKVEDITHALHLQHRRSRRRRASSGSPRGASGGLAPVPSMTKNGDSSAAPVDKAADGSDDRQRQKQQQLQQQHHQHQNEQPKHDPQQGDDIWRSSEPHLKHSWMKVAEQLESGLQSLDSAPLLDRIQGYYSNAGTTISNDAAVLSQKQSRLEHMKVEKKHQAALT
eukprot:CAMPEP_0178377454 /NCGR_PEP_ID=MMETSP0689_2-20121128/3926_1 /TAXON_ID=160604 /ORGANISM="Amphidinium massartii, Strain CS-259" /LENGTH=971 /DNA_ID=CAMNT_0019997507 /DNA_START=131 /DNA_END=3043 /DNA_ORIENTATION=-